jgi:hypothetical protein
MALHIPRFREEYLGEARPAGGESVVAMLATSEI